MNIWILEMKYVHVHTSTITTNCSMLLCKVAGEFNVPHCVRAAVQKCAPLCSF